MSNNNQKQKTRIFFNSIRAENLNPKFRFRKVFHIQKTKNFANNTNIPCNNEGKDLSAKKEIENKKKSNSTKIFFIHKKTKRQPPPIKTIENFNSNLGNIKLSNPKNDIYIDDLKEKIQNTFLNQNALDLRMVKLYHQLMLEQQHQIYFTPDNSSSEEDSPKKEKEMSKYKIIMGFSKKVHCNCKKSNCLKNYCECKRNHERCDKKCECDKCKNSNKNN